MSEGGNPNERESDLITILAPAVIVAYGLVGLESHQLDYHYKTITPSPCLLVSINHENHMKSIESHQQVMMPQQFRNIVIAIAEN